MGHHTTTPPDIDKAIKKSTELAREFQKFTTQLNNDLHNAWKQDMGVPIPTVIQSDVRDVTVFAQYSKGLNVKPFQDGARDLVKAAESPDVATVVDSIVSLVGTVAGEAIGSISVSAKISSSAVKLHSEADKTYIAALYTNVVQADSSRWGVKEEFIVAAIAFVVWQPDLSSPAQEALLEKLALQG